MNSKKNKTKQNDQKKKIKGKLGHLAAFAVYRKSDSKSPY